MKTSIGLFIIVLSLSTQGQQAFYEYVIYNNVYGTQSLFAADMDNDGDNDLLLAASEAHDIIWVENINAASGNWIKHTIDGNFNGAGSVVAADINSDGWLDILAAAKGGDEIAWWKNSGILPISFTKHVIRTGYDFPHEIFATDIDNDGDMDVLAASSLQNEITLWKSNGADTIEWTEQVIATGFTQAKSVHAADFNGDSLIDVVGASLLNNQIIWWENDGSDSILWAPHTVTSTFGGAHRVQAIDLDKDGFIDILGTAWYDNQIAWWRNNGANPPVFTKNTIASNFNRTCMAYACDLDRDNDLDIVATAQDGDQLAWWRNNGDSSTKWTKFIIDDFFDRVWPVHVADMDGDSVLDVIAASGHQGTNEVKWYRQYDNTGIFEDAGYSDEIEVFPNPCRDFIFIKNNSCKHLQQLLVYNCFGQIVLNCNNFFLESEKQIKIAMNHLPDGLYHVYFFYGDEFKIKKIVKF